MSLNLYFVAVLFFGEKNFKVFCYLHVNLGGFLYAAISFLKRFSGREGFLKLVRDFKETSRNIIFFTFLPK
jgi:hypothetical protein